MIDTVSTGEPGDGGVLDLVVFLDLFIEKRPPLLWAGAESTTALSEASLAWAKKSKSGLLMDELDLRKMLDMVRLKLVVEPRVGRLCSGVSGGSWSATGSAEAGGLAGFGVAANVFVDETAGVGAVLTNRGFGVACT